MYKTPQEIAKQKKKSKLKGATVMTIACLFLLENFLHGYLLSGSFAGMNEYMSKMKFLWIPDDWKYFALAGVVFVVYLLYALIVWTDPTVAMNEHDQKGSSKFLEPSSLKKFEEKDPTKNIILSKNVKMSMSNRKTQRNNNLLVLGAAGAGKTFRLISPNLLNVGKENLVCNDVKGEIIIMHGKHLKEKGYDVRCLNTKDMSKSLRFNPMSYIKKESDILSIAKILSETLSGGNKTTGGDAFWDSAKENLITACMAYLWSNRDNNPEMCNIAAINDLLRMAEEEYDENGHSKGSEFDRMMFIFSHENPTSLCARAYGNFKQSTDKTRSNIILTLQNMLSCLDIQEAKELFSGEDELKLWELATEEKIAVFLCSSDTDSTWGWITTLAIALGLNVISNIRDEHPEKGEDVVFWLDEFANGSRIKDCDKIVAVCRSRRIHMKIILQSIVQLQKLYEKEWEAIVENCDTVLSLGAQGKTAKWLSESLGKTGLNTTSKSKSVQAKGGSTSTNFNIESRNLIEPAEIERLDKECIIRIRGEQPVIDEKYQTNLDSRFKLMGDVGNGHSDERNYFFDPEKYRELKIGSSPISISEPQIRVNYGDDYDFDEF